MASAVSDRPDEPLMREVLRLSRALCPYLPEPEPVWRLAATGPDTAVCLAATSPPAATPGRPTYWRSTSRACTPITGGWASPWH